MSNREERDPRRLLEHPILGGAAGGRMVTFTFDGHEVRGIEGEPIAAALVAAGLLKLRETEKDGLPRGVFCAIGHCFECRVSVDGARAVRSCLTPLRAGMTIASREPAEGGGPA
jgi:sarcosine oxidase subunit alpha